MRKLTAALTGLLLASTMAGCQWVKDSQPTPAATVTTTVGDLAMTEDEAISYVQSTTELTGVDGEYIRSTMYATCHYLATVHDAGVSADDAYSVLGSTAQEQGLSTDTAAAITLAAVLSSCPEYRDWLGIR